MSKKLDEVIKDASDDPVDTETQREEEEREEALFDAIANVVSAGEAIATKAIKAAAPAIKAAMEKRKALLVKKLKITPAEWKELVGGEIDNLWEDVRESPSSYIKNPEQLVAVKFLK